MSAARRSKPTQEAPLYRGDDIQAQIAAIEAALAALEDGPFELRPGGSTRDTVAGVLTLLVDRGDHQLGWIVEHATRRRVLCRLPREMDAAQFFGERVAIKGLVVHDAAGSALSVSDVVSMEERPLGPLLTSFIRTTPALPGEPTFEEFIELMRGDD